MQAGESILPSPCQSVCSQDAPLAFLHLFFCSLLPVLATSVQNRANRSPYFGLYAHLYLLPKCWYCSARCTPVGGTNPTEMGCPRYLLDSQLVLAQEEWLCLHVCFWTWQGCQMEALTLRGKFTMTLNWSDSVMLLWIVQKPKRKPAQDTSLVNVVLMIFFPNTLLQCCIWCFFTTPAGTLKLPPYKASNWIGYDCLISVILKGMHLMGDFTNESFY